MKTTNPQQFDRFKDVARSLECDEDETHRDEHLRKLAKVKQAPEKPQ